jgi:cation:H+ antiporter
MNELISIWLQFALCVALIMAAGLQLIKYGDAIAELTGLSRSWIGLILVATVTSLPELVTGLSAVTLASSPDIAIGDALASAVIVASGIWLPLLGVNLARIMGWSHSFVGTLFVALATSVPELATTLGALRIGAVDLAIGSLLGSNLFDVLIIALDDFAYQPGSLFDNVTSLHTVSALTASIMSGAVIVALTYRPVSRVWRIASSASAALLVMYVLNAVLQYRHGQ